MSAANEICLFVSPQGNDQWSGAIAEPNEGDGPFATIERARNAVRALKRKGRTKAPVRIVLRGGTYFLDRPLVLGPQDSGDVECPVTYTAQPGEMPVLSGGRPIGDLREEKLKGRRVWVTEIPEVKRGERYFHQLFVNGERRPRTRLPKRGMYRIKGLPDFPPSTYEKVVKRYGIGASWKQQCRQNRFEYAKGNISRWRNLQDVEIIAPHQWCESHFHIADLDTRKRIVTLDRLSNWSLHDDSSRRGTQYAVYWIENVFEGLDTVGQWYLDRSKGRLYYLPKRGEKLGHAQVVAPRLEQLLRIVGTRKRKVEHLHFEGIAFSHTEWNFPSDMAASVDADAVPGALFLAHTEHCSISHCVIEHIGNWGIQVAGGCMDNEVRHNRIHDMGAGGVKVASDTVTQGIPKAGCETLRTNVTDNSIARCGRIFKTGHGILVSNSPANRILHNHISDLFSEGIVLTGPCSYGKNYGMGNVVEYNHIHHIRGDVLSDQSAIWMGGVITGTRIRYNLIHDVSCRIYGAQGIFLDSASSFALVEKNIVYRCQGYPLHHLRGRENEVVNNIFAFGGEYQILRTVMEPHCSFTASRNIVYYDEGDLLGGKWYAAPNELTTYPDAWSRKQDPGKVTVTHCNFDHNLYFDASGRPVTFAGKTLEDWQEQGIDKGSMIADPLFVDPDNGDFTLRPDSPAFKLGFEPFDISEVGPRR